MAGRWQIQNPAIALSACKANSLVEWPDSPGGAEVAGSSPAVPTRSVDVCPTLYDGGWGFSMRMCTLRGHLTHTAAGRISSSSSRWQNVGIPLDIGPYHFLMSMNTLRVGRYTNCVSSTQSVCYVH